MTTIPEGYERHYGSVFACLVCGVLVDVDHAVLHREWHRL